MLTKEQVNFYNEKGYLHVPQVFTSRKPMSFPTNWIGWCRIGHSPAKAGRPLAARPIWTPETEKKVQTDGDARPSVLFGSMAAGGDTAAIDRGVGDILGQMSNCTTRRCTSSRRSPASLPDAPG